MKLRVWRRLRVESQSKRCGVFLAGFAVDRGDTSEDRARVIPAIAPLAEYGTVVPEDAEPLSTEDTVFDWFRAGQNCSTLKGAEKTARSRATDLIKQVAAKGAKAKGKKAVAKLCKEADALGDSVTVVVIGGA